MVSFKGKSADNPLEVKNKTVSMRGFKVYSDPEKIKGSGGEIVDNGPRTAAKQVMSVRDSLPIRTRINQANAIELLKMREGASNGDGTVKANAGRKALADVSNIKSNLLRTGMSNGSKALRTTSKPLIPAPAARKSFPVKKGIFQTDSGDLLKGSDENSQKSISRHNSSVKVKSGQEVLTDVSSSRTNLSSSGRSNRTKTIKIHKGRSLMPRVTAGQSATSYRFTASKDATSASASSRKFVAGTSRATYKNAIESVHTSKKVDTRDAKCFPENQRTRGPGHGSYDINGRKILRKPPALTRNSLPVLGRATQIGSADLEGNGKKPERGRGKSVNTKVRRKVVVDVSIARNTLWKNRTRGSLTSAKDQTRDIFMSAKDKSGGNTLLQGVPLGQDVIASGGASEKSPEAAATPFKIKDEMLTKVTGSNNIRRQSFTSSLLAKTEVSRACCKVNEKELLPGIDDKKNCLEVAEYVEDIYQYYWVMEAQYPLVSNYMTSQTDINPTMRGILINWLIEVHLKFRLMQETLFLMVALFDRFLSVVTIGKYDMQLVGLTSLLLASKYEDFWHPKVNELISISADSYTRDQMLAMEKLMLKKLMFRLNMPTPYVFMLRFLKASQSDSKVEHLAFYLIELCLTEYEALKYKPSLLCASAIYVARSTLQISPTWTPLLCKHARYEESELRECAGMILRFHRSSGRGQLKVAHDKYTHPDRSNVAQIRPLNRLPQ